MPPTAGWENFYVIAGSAAGALIGLQFVVVTLIADTPAADGGQQGSRAFATPTIVHLGAVLLVAAVLSAPWGGIAAPAWIWGLTGLGGLAYIASVAWRMRTQTAYRPGFEDWLFHAALPAAAYGAFAASAFAVKAHPRGALFAVAAAALLLLFTAIHNAWDSVTYHVFTSRRRAHAARNHPE